MRAYLKYWSYSFRLVQTEVEIQTVVTFQNPKIVETKFEDRLLS